MNDVNPAAIEHTDAMEFDSVLLKTDLLPDKKIELKDVVTHIDIFEHLEKAYLTAILGLSDSEDILSSAYISGGEKIKITLKSTRLDTTTVSKTFYIDKVVATNKTSETAEFTVLHLIEDIGYESTLQNVNKSYSGTPIEILKKISKDFLENRDIESPTSKEKIEAQRIKVIVPNLTPLESMTWIRNRSCTSSGYPFYLVSTLSSEKLQFVDLETLLALPSWNDKPFTYGISLQDKSNPLDTSHRRVILDYNVNNNENLLSLIKQGLVGSEYKFINPTKNEENSFPFDVQEQVIKEMAKKFPKMETSPIPEAFTLRGTGFNKYNSRVLAQVGTTNPYEEDNSYLEENDVSGYKKNAINKALDGIIKKNSMTILVNGTEFFSGHSHHTIGRTIAVRFLRNIPAENTDYHFDNKKSGDFLIFSAKHSMSDGEYVVALSCVKLDNGDVE